MKLSVLNVLALVLALLGASGSGLDEGFVVDEKFDEGKHVTTKCTDASEP
jgi:hypothetical protein